MTVPLGSHSGKPLTEDDFPELERRMKKIIKKGQRFYREELSADEALARIDEMGEPYKREYGVELMIYHCHYERATENADNQPNLDDYPDRRLVGLNP